LEARFFSKTDLYWKNLREMMAFHGLEWVLSTQVLTDCSQKSNFFEIGIMKNSERQKCPDLENRNFMGVAKTKIAALILKSRELWNF